MELTGDREIVLLEPTLGRSLRIMWAWYWRYITLGFGPFAVALSLKVFEHQIPDDPNDLESMYFVFVALAALAPFWAFPYAFKMVMNKTFKNFRIGFADLLSATPPNFVAPTLRQVWTVWWAVTWRSALWAVLGIELAVVAVVVGAMNFYPAWGSSPALGTPGIQELLMWLLAHVGWFIASVFTLRRILNKDFEHFR